ncbi:phenylacetate-CoA oxygenase/reductase subunit PaaK [Serratia plymuthica]|uniref:1,2-phenylacetyl-CoA epoxidase subunit PaaE n=1 Tax=Serratia plymuthica TaxID=82996 RepID=UPI001F534E8E|nr:1,2-phenylacetyl-CoA epoxidase subunit PaaE [Serratia plymuthica]UNK30003.1 phenylacetate-CoA oxygenase/reductase subunit PaaK [Serratia plymuthica]
MTLFHRLNVAAIERETPDAVAITLRVPDELKSHYRYTPGQHLTLKAWVNGEELRRCYSICSAPQEGLLQIGVKAIHQGRFSSFVNQMLQVGDALEVMVPQGRFGYQPQAENCGNYLAIAAGSGITPMLSIIKATLQLEANSRFTLIYGNRSSRSVMFKEALCDLKNRYPQRFQPLYLFSQESLDSPLLRGRIDRERLTAIGSALLDYRDYDHAFICGPEAMMDDAQTVLEQAGVPAAHIHSERFNTSGIAARPLNDGSRNATQVEILLDGRRLNIEVGAQDDSILDAALRQGADLPYACKGGVCATCKCRLKAGQVEMAVNYSLEPDQLAAGYVLSCQSWPRGDGVVLDFDV